MTPLLRRLPPLLLLATGCEDSSPSTPQGLAGRDWRLTELRVEGAPEPVPALAQLRFDGAGGVGGSSGCNSIGGEARFRGDGSIALGPLMQTEMACDEPRMRQEAAFTRVLASATRWSLQDGTLVLFSADGLHSASFRPM